MNIIRPGDMVRTNPPIFRKRFRWIEGIVLASSLLGTLALLRWFPGAPHIHAALATLGAGLLFQLALSALLLLNSSAWSRWVNPAADPSWAKKLLWGEAFTSIFLLALLAAMVWQFRLLQ